MESPLGSQELDGFLDLAFEPCRSGMELDNASSLPCDLLLDDDGLALAPAAGPGAPDQRAQLLATALRGQPESQPNSDVTIAAGRHGSVLREVDNNAVLLAGAPSASCEPAAVSAAAPAPPAAPTAAAAAAAVVAVKQEPRHQPRTQARAVAAAAAAAADSDSDDAGGKPGGNAKRRRRIRNAKQQELNRLAQQRYRERKKQKYCSLQGTVDELSTKLSTLSTLEAANSELSAANVALQGVVSSQAAQLAGAQDTIAKQAAQIASQAAALQGQAAALRQQGAKLEQQERQLDELRARVAAGAGAPAPGPPGRAAAAAVGGSADADPSNDQLALAVRAVLTGVSSMATVLPAKDAASMQSMVATLPDGLLQQLRSCCREVALHLKKSGEVAGPLQPISVPCC